GSSRGVGGDGEGVVVEEVLGVGDGQFQRKCFEVFAGLKRQRKTILLVSHDVGSVQRFCEHVYWLDKGRLVMAGEASEVIQTYLAASQAAGLTTSALASDAEAEGRWGGGKAAITQVTING